MSKLFPGGEYPARFTVATSFRQRARFPSAPQCSGAVWDFQIQQLIYLYIRENDFKSI